MGTILVIGIIWALYGLAGLFGIQKIPSKFKDKSWTKHYIRYQGISWLLLGIPWIVLDVITEDKGFGMPVMLFLILACSLPGFVYTVILDRRYTAKLKLEQ